MGEDDILDDLSIVIAWVFDLESQLHKLIVETSPNSFMSFEHFNYPPLVQEVIGEEQG